MNETKSYMEPEESKMHNIVDRIGRYVNERVKIFHIETTLNNRMFDKPLEFLSKNEKEDYEKPLTIQIKEEIKKSVEL